MSYEPADKSSVHPMCGECGRPIPDRKLRALLAVEAEARALFEFDMSNTQERGEALEMLVTALAGADDT